MYLVRIRNPARRKTRTKIGSCQSLAVDDESATENRHTDDVTARNRSAVRMSIEEQQLQTVLSAGITIKPSNRVVQQQKYEVNDDLSFAR